MIKTTHFSFIILIATIPININLSGLSNEDIDQMAKKLDPYFTTNREVEHVVEHSDLIKYSDLDLKPEN